MLRERPYSRRDEAWYCEWCCRPHAAYRTTSGSHRISAYCPLLRLTVYGPEALRRHACPPP